MIFIILSLLLLMNCIVIYIKKKKVIQTPYLGYPGIPNCTLVYSNVLQLQSVQLLGEKFIQGQRLSGYQVKSSLEEPYCKFSWSNAVHRSKQGTPPQPISHLDLCKPTHIPEITRIVSKRFQILSEKKLQRVCQKAI